MFQNLKDKKVVLFGAGHNGKIMLKNLIDEGITPAYFVDNNQSITSVGCAKIGGVFSVKTPEFLLGEDKSKLKIIIPPASPWFSEIENQVKAMGLGECLNLPTAGNNKCNICNIDSIEFLPFGIVPRDKALCPHCKSLERHRFLWFYLERENILPKDTNQKIKLLHFAPEKVLFNKFSSNINIDYYPVDYNPKFPNIRDVVDITNIPYADNTFDLIICSHVMEHIVDEKKALAELQRVLRPEGIALIIVPLFEKLETTLENLEYTPEERLKYYGQKDHVRKYGRDFTERLTKGGFTVEKISAKTTLSPETRLILGMGREDQEHIHKCTL